jgi:hypothetical protein
MAYRNPRVASIAQFLFVDDKPILRYAEGDPKRWMTWQSGLFTQNGVPKPFLRDYILPLYTVQDGLTVRIFGAYRPGRAGTPVDGRVEYSRGNGQWVGVRNFRTSNPRGYISSSVTVPGPGFVRILWRDPVSGSLISTTPARVN